MKKTFIIIEKILIFILQLGIMLNGLKILKNILFHFDKLNIFDLSFDVVFWILDIYLLIKIKQRKLFGYAIYIVLILFNILSILFTSQEYAPYHGNLKQFALWFSISFLLLFVINIILLYKVDLEKN